MKQAFKLLLCSTESLGNQSPPENGNETQILCVSEVIEHPNHYLRILVGGFNPSETYYSTVVKLDHFPK